MSLIPSYRVEVTWSEPDGAYLAQVPDLAGCMADGETRQEAIAAAEVVIAEWIETAKELGRPIPEPRGRLMFA
ncbi:MAG TPA: type II toxin-antitoxin system HicB family antitoxin [Urbifossiella sp.]|nr:type II toxin-antitoxin system HicB family antitoxin [Urbifossiella sp.]